jgi:hypothetical protein
VDAFTRAINALLQLLIQLGHILLDGIVAIEVWLRTQLAMFGLPPAIQTAVMVAVAVVLILAALRLFGGLIRVAVILLLLLVVLHVLLPIIQHP